MMRKAQIFLLDLIFSIVIILVSLGIIFSYYSVTSQNTDLYTTNKELIQSLTQTKINTLNNDEIRDLFINNQIRNVDNTVAQQIGEYYVTGQLALAQNVSEFFMEDFLLEQYNFNLSLHNGTTDIFLHSEQPSSVAFEDASISSSITRTVFGIINETTSYGPYEFTIQLWQ